LSDDLELGAFNCTQCIDDYSSTKSRAKLETGTCHAITIWVEYEIEISNGVYQYISSGNKYHQQAVRFLEEPMHVNETVDKLIEIKMLLDCGDNLNDLEFDIHILSS